MAQVELFKKEGTYIDEKDKKEKRATRFYLRCGNTFVPIEVSYFENKKLGRDPAYSGRKEVLKAFADILPEKANN